jgi:hypothetical protein
MSQFLRSLGRDIAIVNLDPANENMAYTSGEYCLLAKLWLLSLPFGIK